MPAEPSKTKKSKDLSFEQALNRLEEIVGAMESGDLPLEKMTAFFEEGHALVRQCGRRLDEVERKIEVLMRKGDQWVAEPLDPEGEPGPDRVTPGHG